MLQISCRLNECATRLRHFFTVYRDITMHENIAWFAEIRPFQHRRPEQAMEIHNIFTDKMIQLGGRILIPKIIKIQTALFATQIFKRCHITDRRVQPNVEIFIFSVRNFKAEIRRITRNIPLLQTSFKPFLHFIRHFCL